MLNDCTDLGIVETHLQRGSCQNNLAATIDSAVTGGGSGNAQSACQRVPDMILNKAPILAAEITGHAVWLAQSRQSPIRILPKIGLPRALEAALSIPTLRQKPIDTI